MKVKVQELERLLQLELPKDIKTDLKIQYKMLQLKQFQVSVFVFAIYPFMSQDETRTNIVSKMSVKKDGDSYYEKALIDRFYYKRARILSMVSKKDAKSMERFEQQMRNGQEQRKKARHNRFLSDLLTHSKEFWEFHKKKIV